MPAWIENVALDDARPGCIDVLELLGLARVQRQHCVAFIQERLDRVCATEPFALRIRM